MHACVCRDVVLVLKHVLFCGIIGKGRDKRNRGINSYLLFCIERGRTYETETIKAQSAACWIYIIFHVFWRGESDFPAFSWGTGRQPYMAGNGGVPHKRGGASCIGRGGGCAFRRASQPGKESTSCLRVSVHAADLPVHRTMSGHSKDGQHLL